LRLLAFMLAAGCALGANAQMNKCVDKDGKVTYQQRPCEGAVILPLPPASKTGPGAPPATPAANRDGVLRELAFQLGVNDWCAPGAVEGVGYDSAVIAAIIEWRGRHADVMREIDSVPAYREIRELGRSSYVKRYGLADPRTTAACAQNARLLLSTRL
jgi:hypothetical protein